MAFNWNTLKFWQKKEKTNDNADPYASTNTNKPVKDKPKKRPLRKLALISTFGVVAAGGGTAYYNYQTEKDVTFKINSIERVYDIECKKRIVETIEEFTERNERGYDVKQKRDVTKELQAEQCKSTPVAYILHTDKGDFVNNPSLLHGKLQDKADKLQATFTEGATYSGRAYGVDLDIPGTSNDVRRNILSAEKVVYSYKPYTYNAPSKPR